MGCNGSRISDLLCRLGGDVDPLWSHERQVLRFQAKDARTDVLVPVSVIAVKTGCQSVVVRVLPKLLERRAVVAHVASYKIGGIAELAHRSDEATDRADRAEQIHDRGFRRGEVSTRDERCGTVVERTSRFTCEEPRHDERSGAPEYELEHAGHHRDRYASVDDWWVSAVLRTAPNGVTNSKESW